MSDSHELPRQDALPYFYDEDKPWASALKALVLASIDGDTKAAQRFAHEAEALGCRTVDQWFVTTPKPLVVIVYRCAECRRVFGTGDSAKRSACFVNTADGRHWHYDRTTTDPAAEWGWRGRWAEVEDKSLPVTFDEGQDQKGGRPSAR